MSKELNSLREMMESCFTYGGIETDSYNFERYLSPYIEKLGAKRFEKAYEKYAKDLRENYRVEYCTGMDGEGNLYNSLIKTKL